MLLPFRRVAVPRIGRPLPAVLALVVVLDPGCVVHERCYRNSDCTAPYVCSAAGRCEPLCRKDADCGSGFVCEAGVCKPRPVVPDVAGDGAADIPAPPPLQCPDDMLPIANTFCIDRYEASRPDATETSVGGDGSRATARVGVMPWLVPDNATAAAACVAAGKRLCSEAEWAWACAGPEPHVYGYGDAYDPLVCNGIETFGPGGFHLMPTGSFAGCTNGFGVFDMNGNVWEHVLDGSSQTVRGGAFNCSDSRQFHRCDYVPRTWTPSALGFRCCIGAAELPPPAADAAGER